MSDITCQCCKEEFLAEYMCDHFDDPNKHQWCSGCCDEFNTEEHEDFRNDLD